ncbi:MAG: alpha/beta hydrolase [Pseudolabrys sp.]|nr:alpha/beta hydrolase [Pseudolabrys sp.]
MIIAIVVAVLVVLAGVTLAGTWAIERANPPTGRFVDVDGGRLHVVEVGAPDAPPLLLLHGASGNLNDLRLAIGDRLAQRYRVILVDRPGHGWSDRPGGAADALPSAQAKLIHQAVTSLGIKKPIVLGHSWSGSLATAYALAYPDDVRGLVLLAPVTHPWPGGIGWINDVVAMPIIGQLTARTLVLPAGYFMLQPGVASVFRPNTPPADYNARTGVAMLLRPSEFIANAQDLSVLKEFVRAQSQRYSELKMPVEIIAGDVDPVVYTDVHSRAIARQVPQAVLTVLPGLGHMVQYTATDRVIQAVDDVAARSR